MGRFKVGDRVSIVGGSIAVGENGTVKEIQGGIDTPIGYHVLLDGEKYGQVYLERNLVLEDMLEREIFPLGEWSDFIPDGITDTDDFFRELAEIYPKYNEHHNIKRNRFKVSVIQEGEGPVPHVHVYYEHKGSKDDIAYICLGKAEYAPRHRNETKLLDSKEKKDLIKFFNTFQKGIVTYDNNGEPVPANCWQECVDIWIRTYEPRDLSKYFDIDEETGLCIMPDYSEL